MQRLKRLSAILVKLQSKQLITAPQLAIQFEVSIRTIYRDVKALIDSGVPVIVIEGKGYQLIDGYTLPPVMFSEEEANALITAAHIINKNKDSSLVKNHTSAIDKVIAVLKSVDKAKARQLQGRMIYIKNLTERRTSGNLADVQKAITSFNCLRLAYKSQSKEEVTTRIVEPLALYHTSDNWILVAWCRLRKAYREFRLDRIDHYYMISDQFQDRHFDLVKYLISSNNP